VAIAVRKTENLLPVQPLGGMHIGIGW
jgi:hypothetical protein